MSEVVATTVFLIGLLVGGVANYWAWSWILAVRRRTRVRRLARPDGPPPGGEQNQSADGRNQRRYP